MNLSKKDKIKKKAKFITPNQFLIIGKFYLLRGDRKKALDEYRKATIFFPDYPLGHFFLAETYWDEAKQIKSKQVSRWKFYTNKAMTSYKKVIFLAPQTQLAEKSQERLLEIEQTIDKQL